MPEFDLRPAADRMAALVGAVPDDALSRPTPCTELTVAHLVAHIDGFAQAFAAAARKDFGPMTTTPPGPTSELSPTWRADAAAHLDDLAVAWREPAAWEGMTQAGGVDLPGEIAARVALDELVVHGWDLARATGLPYDVDESDVSTVEATVQQFRGGNDGEIPGLFGPAVDVPDGAPALSRLVGLTGRNPGWQPG